MPGLNTLLSIPNGPALRKYYYVRCKQTFEELDGGRVLVPDKDGKSGTFTWDGEYLEGELTTVNEQMLLYVAGPAAPRICHYRWTEAPVSIDRPSGWPERLEEVVAHQVGRR